MGKPTCAYCGSKNITGYSRVVGYFSPINNWNLGKIAELKDRQKGNYKLGGKKDDKSK